MSEVFSTIYESIYYVEPFSDDMFNEDLYTPIGIWTLVISGILCVGFYYGINHPRFNRIWHWFIIALINSLICSALAYFLPENALSSLDLEYGKEYFIFAGHNAWISFVVFILFSYLIRWKSTKCSHTPIPL